MIWGAELLIFFYCHCHVYDFAKSSVWGNCWWLEGLHGCSLWVWWSLEFKGITATEWLGRVPGRGGVCVCVCVCVCVRVSLRVPDQLISILSPLIPPLSPSSRAALCRGQIPTFLSPLLDIKCLSVPSRPPAPHPAFPSALIASSLAMPITTSTVSFACPVVVIVLGRER